MKKFIGTLTIIFIPFLLSAWPSEPAPEINALSAILLDGKTGTVLYEKNADEMIPPASMTKLMTIHTALKFINDGRAGAEDLVPISRNADFRNQPPRSSLMFIEQGQRVSLMELLQGLALPSGNDAGIAVAEYLSGSLDDFVKLMNKEAVRLGMHKTHFDDSSGLSEKNLTTARDYASFCRYYIEENAAYMEKLHQQESFTYPKEQNLPESGSSVHGPITQPNHNLLTGRMAFVDGLKTGYIDESGYNFAATAEQNGRRLVLVTMGGSGKNSADGALRRALDAASLLTYGFYAWTAYTQEVPEASILEIYGGTKNSLKVSYSPAEELLIETSFIDELELVPVYHEIELPIERGQIIGKWELVRNNNVVLQNGTISAAESIGKGNLLKRIVDSFKH